MRLPWISQSRASKAQAASPGAGRRAASPAHANLPVAAPAHADGVDAKAPPPSKAAHPLHPAPSSPRSKSPRIGARAASPIAAILRDHAALLDHRIQLLIPLLRDPVALAAPAALGQSPVELAVQAVRLLPSPEQRKDAVALAVMVAAATAQVDRVPLRDGTMRSAERVLGRALAAAMTVDAGSRDLLVPSLAHGALLSQGSAANRALVGHVAGAGADFLGAAAARLQAAVVGLMLAERDFGATAPGGRSAGAREAAAKARRHLAEASEGPLCRDFLDSAHNDLALLALAHRAGIPANPAGLFRDGLVVEDLGAYRDALARRRDNPYAQRLLMTIDVYNLEHPASSRAPYGARVRTLADLLKNDQTAPSLEEILGRHQLPVAERAEGLDRHLQPATLAGLNVPGRSPLELAVQALATARNAAEHDNAVAMATAVAGRTYSALVDHQAGSPAAAQMFTRALDTLMALDRDSITALGSQLVELALLARGTTFLAATARAIADTPGDVWAAAAGLMRRTLPAELAAGGSHASASGDSLPGQIQAHLQRCTVDLALSALARRAGLEPPSAALFLRDNKIFTSLAQRRGELAARAGHPDADALLMVIDMATATAADKALRGDALTAELGRMLGG